MIISTKQQLLAKKYKKYKKRGLRFLKGKPQRRGICQQVTWVAPKKPNSARRKVAKVLGYLERKGTFCYIPGEDHDLKEHAIVLVRGGRTRDIPGMKYKIMRGLLDSLGILWRQNGRSKYGTKRLFRKKLRKRRVTSSKGSDE